jgi:hypothetical protein
MYNAFGSIALAGKNFPIKLSTFAAALIFFSGGEECLTGK